MAIARPGLALANGAGYFFFFSSRSFTAASSVKSLHQVKVFSVAAAHYDLHKLAVLELKPDIGGFRVKPLPHIGNASRAVMNPLPMMWTHGMRLSLDHLSARVP